MCDFSNRQLGIAEQLISEYEIELISLNIFIQRIEGVALAIGNDFWENIISPIIDPLEEVNSFALDEHRSLDANEKMIVAESMKKLKNVLQQYRVVR
ncbi:hypothetical protein [Noviherbaspirillum soli]|uniref:hypothetical protein n=1 Tax=Noviherbaspirillum soli TaxID=1064518 RepID=UPI00188A92BB|nr:hypothetical protein [Noviherbaspirillum soli]